MKFQTLYKMALDLSVPLLFHCKENVTVPAVPPTLFLSYTEPSGPEPIAPYRSTFCFPESSQQYKSQAELIKLRTQWDTFERIENYNSIVLNQLASIVPVEAPNGVITPAFYQFINSAEKSNYNMGQLAHTVAYPDVSDFLTSYAARPIPYTSTVMSTIASIRYDISGVDVACSNILPPPPLDSDIILRNRKGLSLYVRVSTQMAQYPKSPYKFTSNNEYITYNEFKQAFACPGAGSGGAP